MPLLLVAGYAGGGSSAVRFVNDDEVGAMLEEIGAFAVALDEVNADDLELVVAVNAAATVRYSPLKLVHRAGADDHGVQAEFFAQFFLPLLAKVRRTQDAETFDFAPVQQFAGDEQALNGFADADIVGDEHTDGIEAQGHQERDKLVGSRADGHAAQGPQRCCAFAKR